jgi:hypothetical protein
MATTAEQRRKEAAEFARKRATERQQERSSGNHIMWQGDFFEKPDKKQIDKGDSKTLVRVIPYIVEEKNHPDKVRPGMLWYRRQYGLHVVGANKQFMVCPTSFNKRNTDIMDTEFKRLSDEFWKEKPKMSKKDADEKYNQIRTLKAKEREIYYFWLYSLSKLVVYEDSTGAFGDLLDTRIKTVPTRPSQEGWAAFYLDGDDGMALEITWEAKDIGQQNPWIKAAAIDFIELKDVPAVPKEVWEQVKEMSTLLKPSTPEDIQAAFLEDETEVESENTRHDNHGGAIKEELTANEQASKGDDDIPFEQAPESASAVQEPAYASKAIVPGEDELMALDKEQLLDFAKEKGLKDDKGKDIHRMYRRESEDVVFAVVRDSYAKIVELRNAVVDGAVKEEPVKTTDPDSCPFNLTIGASFNDDDKCNDCDNEHFEKCKVAFDALQK